MLYIEKSLVLSISLGTSCYRHIQISESATLYRLSSAILDSVNFDNDHLHSFFMSNRFWDGDNEYAIPDGGDPDGARGYSDKVKLSKFHFRKGDKFLYLFDYGDEWRFQINVLHVIDEPTKSPVVLKSVGEVSQYGDDDWDEDWDEGNGEDIWGFLFIMKIYNKDGRVTVTKHI